MPILIGILIGIVVFFIILEFLFVGTAWLFLLTLQFTEVPVAGMITTYVMFLLLRHLFSAVGVVTMLAFCCGMLVSFWMISSYHEDLWLSDMSLRVPGLVTSGQTVHAWGNRAGLVFISLLGLSLTTFRARRESISPAELEHLRAAVLSSARTVGDLLVLLTYGEYVRRGKRPGDAVIALIPLVALVATLLGILMKITD